jgi:L-threonylcarbamoyladenylate synthase
VIVHVADVGAIGGWAAEVPTAARELAAAFWPGPLTLVLKRDARVPDLITGGRDTVAAFAGASMGRALLQRFGGAVAAPSANRFGRIKPDDGAARHR